MELLNKALKMSFFVALCVSVYIIKLTFHNVYISNIIKMEQKYCFRLIFGENLSLKYIVNFKRDFRENYFKNNSGQPVKGHKMCGRFIKLKGYQGRMGNQMFQIASLIGIAYKYDVIPIIQPKFPLNRYFELPNVVDTTSYKLSNVSNCACVKSAVYYNCTQEFKTGKNMSLWGFMQSWKYFRESNDVIRKIFRPRIKYLQNAQNFLKNLSIADYQVVCIHIRRGDFTLKTKLVDGFTVAGVDFIEKAKQFYVKKYSKVQFLVVSDDKAWCRRNLKDVIISPFSDAGDEMALMSLSNHVVVTSGTYGWWGAWLSGGTTVYYDKYPRPGSALATRINVEDYYPPSWIGIS